MDSLNRMAVGLVDEAIDFAEELSIAAHELENAATVLDFGHEVAGGIEAGLLLAEIQTAGLATVQTRMDSIAGAPVPHVELATDRPAIATLCAQKAGWEVSIGEFEGLGSGPARALVGEEDVFSNVGYHDAFEYATLAIETDRLPGEAVAEHVADRASVAVEDVFLLAFPTGSLVGSVTTAARAAELAVFRLAELGYDPTAVRSAVASAPVAPVCHDEELALGRTNDALAYGGQVHLTVTDEFDRFDDVPSTAADEYGTPFETIFETVEWDFYALAESVFAPAQVTVNVIDGRTHVLGEPHESVLAESFGLDRDP